MKQLLLHKNLHKKKKGAYAKPLMLSFSAETPLPPPGTGIGSHQDSQKTFSGQKI